MIERSGRERYILWGEQETDSGWEEAMKFLVLWHFDLTRLGPEVARAVMLILDYAKKLGDKLECRYHVIGSHGGAWIYKVTSNEELDRLLAMSPMYNYATYQVLPLAEMVDPTTITGNASWLTGHNPSRIVLGRVRNFRAPSRATLAAYVQREAWCIAPFRSR